MTQYIRHEGIQIEQHGRRWRWRLRRDGEVIVRSFESIEKAVTELDRSLVERERRRRESNTGATQQTTVAELCKEWFRYKKPHLQPGTVQQYGIHIRVHIEPIIGAVDANRLRPRDLEDFYASQRWKAARESHNILKQTFEWAIRNEMLARESNPCLVVRPSRRACIDHDGTYDSDERIRPVDEKAIPAPVEVEKLVVDAEHRGFDAWWLYLEIARATGARPGEICALQRKHIDIDALTVRIEWTADKVSGRIKRPKTSWGIRTLPLSPPCADTISLGIGEDPEAYLFPSNTYRGAMSPLPCWNSRSVSRRLDQALERCGLPHYTPHGFRHYVATHLLAQGCAPMQVARFLGHADDTLVRKLYGRHIVDHAQEAIGFAATEIGAIPGHNS